MNCAHIAKHAAELVVVPTSDADRVTAFAHAATCSACAKVLREAQSTLALLDAYAQPVSPDAATLARIRTQLAREIAASASRWAWAFAVVAMVSAAIAIVAGGDGPLDAHLGLHCLGFELALAAPAFLGAVWFVRRGTISRPTLSLATAAAAGALTGQAMLLQKCDALASYAHNLTFHMAAVLMAAALGYAAGLIPWQTLGSKTR